MRAYLAQHDFYVTFWLVVGVIYTLIQIGIGWLIWSEIRGLRRDLCTCLTCRRW